MPDVIGIWAWGTPEEERSELDEAGVFDVIRRSEKGAPIKAYRFLVKVKDDCYWMSYPIKDINYGHYLNALPEWLNPSESS